MARGALFGARALATAIFAASTVLLSLVPSSANAIDLKTDLIQELTRYEVGEHRERYDLETLEVDEFADHSELKIEVTDQSISLRLKYDQTALTQPHLLVPDAILFWYIKNVGAMPIAGLTPQSNPLLENFGPKASFYSIGELIQNARLGDPASRARLLRWKAAAIKDLKISNEFEAQFPGTRAAIKSRYRELNKQIDELNTLQRHRQSAVLDSEKLKELVAKNDRAGVAALLKSGFDWDSMQPTEKKFWQTWIQAIEKPSAAKRVWLFRGFQDAEAYKRSRISSLGSIAFLSARSLPSDEHFDVERSTLKGRRLETVHKIADLMHTHAEAIGGSSMFMSFSSEFDVAEGFVSGTDLFPGPRGQLLAVRIDSRRLLPNVANSIGREFEYLVPMFVFPDEVELLMDQYSPEKRAAFIQQVEAKGYRQRDQRTLWTDLWSSGIQMFRVNENKQSQSAETCRALFH